MTVSEQDENGYWHHKITQSWMGTALTCLEKARRGSLPADDPHQIGWVDSDSTIVGSAVHHAIEQAVQSMIVDEQTWPLEWVLSEYNDRFNLLFQQREVYVPGGDNTWEDRDDEHQIVWIKRRKPDTARDFGNRALTGWYDEVYPNLDPWATEVSFGPIRILHDETREVVLTGTIDYMDRVLGPWDWKTASRAYERWEKERWNIQRTVYGWALRHAGFTGVDAIDQYPGPTDRFTFCVLGDFNSAPQIVEVTSTDEHDRWLKHQIESLLPLMESGATVWPKNDSHALCSPKWCEAWDTCKGLDLKEASWAQPVDKTPYA